MVIFIKTYRFYNLKYYFCAEIITNMKHSKIYPIGITAFIIILLAVLLFFFFYPINRNKNIEYVFIDNDDNIDSIALKMEPSCTVFGLATIKALARHTEYAENIRAGRYEIDSSVGALMLFRKLRNGQQKPIMLTIPSVRTKERLAQDLANKLMIGADDILKYLNNNDSCMKFGLDTAKITTLFIPNTYEIYWNISAGKLLSKMKEENAKFWIKDRTSKAAALGLSKEEVITLASIIEEETANDKEKPRIAGMYYNRLKKPMPLQADPTIKYALKDFSIKRIYNNMLRVNSPYNTYINEGLPPGPIRIPSIVSIDAVLNLEHHTYLYMCAKEDFSGTHNFANTYEEHLQNAARYSKALNERNIGKY